MIKHISSLKINIWYFFLSWAGSILTRTTIILTLLIARQSGKINLRPTQDIFYIYSGDDPNKPCVFPFIYPNDDTIYSCTNVSGAQEVCCDGTHSIKIPPM